MQGTYSIFNQFLLIGLIIYFQNFKSMSDSNTQQLNIDPEEQNRSYLSYLKLKQQIQVQMEEDKLSRLVEHAQFVVKVIKNNVKKKRKKPKEKLFSYSLFFAKVIGMYFNVFPCLNIEQEISNQIIDMIFCFSYCGIGLKILNSIQLNKISIYSTKFSQALRKMILVQQQGHNFSKQCIINYERKLIQSCSQSLPKPTLRKQSKYSICQLNKKVHQLIRNKDHNLRWLGNHNSSSIQAYIYCLLMLSISSNRALMQFKSAFYQLCREYLSFKQQKLVVEFLCLLQFSSDKFLFLKKYPTVENIIYTVFEKVRNQGKNGSDCGGNEGGGCEREFHSLCIERTSTNDYAEILDSATGQLFHMNRLAEIYTKFSEKFHFLQLKKSSEFSFQLSIENNNPMYIIIEKEYFFILQPLQQIEIPYHQFPLVSNDKTEVERKIQHHENSFSPIQKSKSPSKHKLIQNSQTYKRQILNFNIKTQSAQERSISPKPEYKSSYFTKRPNTSQFIQEISPNKNPKQKKQQYLDLMQSSFQEYKTLTHEKEIQKKQQKKNESNNFHFYKPKFFHKPFSPPPNIHPNKAISIQKYNKTITTRHDCSPSQADKRFFKLTNNQDRQKQSMYKQTKFNSSRELNRDHPDRKQIGSPGKNSKKDQINSKTMHDLSTNIQSRKEQFKFFDKRYRQNKEEKQKTFNHEINPKFSQKSNKSFSYNPKIINNRISLQSKKDLDLLFKHSTQNSIISKTPEVSKFEEEINIEAVEKKKVMREELSKSLNKTSQVQLKSRLFEHFGKNFHVQNFNILPKQSKSIQKHSRLDSQVPRIVISECESHSQISSQQCPEIIQENYGEYEIRINLAPEKHNIQ